MFENRGLSQELHIKTSPTGVIAVDWLGTALNGLSVVAGFGFRV